MNITARIHWKNSPPEDFLDGRYLRTHHWAFDGGMIIPVSSSPQVVAVPFSDSALVDPEEAFVASLASCHMLFFLSIAAKKKVRVESYEDNPEAVMAKNESGKTGIYELLLKPKIRFGTDHLPDIEIVNAIHAQAHANCFLANSVKTKITIQSIII